MSDTTTKEDGNLAQALEWLNAPREVLTAQQAAEQEAAWMDATLDAAGFFALEHVTPVQAAMLLCRFSPHDSAESEAESCTTDCTSPDDFKRLRLTFASIDQNRPARRSLLDWMDIAAGAGRTIHPWAHRYAEHHGLYDQPRPEPTSVAPPLNEAPTPDEPAPTIMKKKALIAHLKHEWPSIEADLKDATRNGLKGAADAGVHGDWRVEPARAWAQRKGKLKQAAPAHLLDAWNGPIRRHKI